MAGYTSTAWWTNPIKQLDKSTEVISADRIYLIEFAPNQFPIEYIDLVVSWLNDKETMKYSEQGNIVHSSTSQILYLLSEFPARINSFNRYWFIVCRDKERDMPDKLIGTLTTRHIHLSEEVDIGILLGDKNERGHGYAIEAMSAVINNYSQLGIKRFTIGTMLKNRPMINLAKALGMKKYKKDDFHLYMEMRTS